MELHARSGRAVLVGVEHRRELDPAGLPLPKSLVDALHEWARVADTLAGREQPDDEVAQLVSRRGRQLALRLALETGGEVGYLDPLSGEINRVGLRRQAPQPALREPAPPTPWATGGTISAIIGAIVTVSLVVISLGLAQVNWLLALGVNVLVVVGFAPSIRLASRMLVWRWVAFGAAGGIVASWVALLLSLLG